MGNDDMTCDRCGGPLVDASPVEIYCPNEACWEADHAVVRAAFARMRDPKDAEIARLTTERDAAVERAERARAEALDEAVAALDKWYAPDALGWTYTSLRTALLRLRAEAPAAPSRSENGGGRDG